MELDIDNYDSNLINIRKNYDSTVHEYQKEISRKNDDIKFMAETHGKEIREVILFFKSFLKI